MGFEPVIIISGVLILAIFTLIGIIRANLKICQPNEVLIFSGRERRLSDGTRVGYRIIRGGRGFRIPLLEQVDRLVLNTIPIDLTVENAYSKGGIPLTVRAIANVKVSSNEIELANAVERLLGKNLDEIQRLAKETLEGNLRGVLASLTPEEVNEDRLKFAKELLDEADQDLGALGLQLDTLKIQSVEDDRGYLDAIGRQQSAHIIAAAEIAEAQKEESARLAQAEAKMRIIQAENEVRVSEAQLAAVSEAEEAKVSVARRLAEVKAQQEVAEEEVRLTEKEQRAKVVVAAEAQRRALEEIAIGDAAKILETGKAEVEVLRQKLELWTQGGTDSERLFLIQMLPDILSQIVATVDNLKIDKLTVVDSGQGTGVPSVFNQIAGATPALLESLKASTGVDIAGMLGSVGTPNSTPGPAGDGGV